MLLLLTARKQAVVVVAAPDMQLEKLVILFARLAAVDRFCAAALVGMDKNILNACALLHTAAP
jgi:hypothetical protein